MTAVDICNVALGRIGIKAFIDDLDNTSSMEAVVCKQFFQPALDSMLAMFPWDFTQGLVQLTGPLANPRNGWAYMYTLPADCLNPIRLQLSGVVFPPASKDRFAYQIGYDSAAGMVILTNYPDLYLVYTRKVTDFALLPPVFCDALSWKIAADAAMALAVKGDFEQVARERYHQTVSNAAATSLRIGQDEGTPPSELITVRY